jgi:hypothetical protein
VSESREREGRERGGGSWICHFYNVKGIQNSGEWEGDISDWLLSLWLQCRVLSSHSDGSCSITLNASKWWQMSIIYRLRHSILSRHLLLFLARPPHVQCRTRILFFVCFSCYSSIVLDSLFIIHIPPGSLSLSLVLQPTSCYANNKQGPWQKTTRLQQTCFPLSLSLARSRRNRLMVAQQYW